MWLSAAAIRGPTQEPKSSGSSSCASPHGVRFYAGFDSDGRQQARRLRPHGAWRVNWFRGLAQDQLARGADGVYVFNWHGHAQTHRPLLTTMGSIETLTGLDKVYTALHRSIGPKTGNRVDAERDDRLYGEVPVTLYPTLTDCGPVFHVRVADEVETEGQLAAAELQIEMAHWSPADQIEVTLDESRVASARSARCRSRRCGRSKRCIGERLALLELDRSTGEDAACTKSGCGC